jgi:hypothetical protein
MNDSAGNNGANVTLVDIENHLGEPVLVAEHWVLTLPHRTVVVML